MKNYSVLLIPFFWAATASAQNLFGDPPCEEWEKTAQPARQVWVNALLAPLNMAYVTRIKPAEDLFSKLTSLDEALSAVSTYCAENPQGQASGGALLYLSKLHAEK
jgi:hypothetical protein